MNRRKIRLLPKKEILKAITLKRAIEEVMLTFRDIKKREIVERVIIETEKAKGNVLFMPFYSAEKSIMGAKIIGVFPENHFKKIPVICGTLILVDSKTGQTLAIMDAEFITALRTAAITALATDILSRKNSKILLLVGAGVQGQMQTEAVLEVRQIERVFIYDIKKEKSEALAKYLRAKYGKEYESSAASSLEGTVEKADIIVTATTSCTPVFDGNLVCKGTHISAIGAFKPNTRELDDVVLSRSRIFVDSYDQSLKEAGDIIIALKNNSIEKSDILAEMGELVRKEKVGRRNDKDITLFKSVGLAVQDIALAHKIYQRAQEQNLGEMILLNE